MANDRMRRAVLWTNLAVFGPYTLWCVLWIRAQLEGDMGCRQLQQEQISYLAAITLLLVSLIGSSIAALCVRPWSYRAHMGAWLVLVATSVHEAFLRANAGISPLPSDEDLVLVAFTIANAWFLRPGRRG